VIAADGASSALRQMAGIPVVAHDYRQSGVVTTIAHELPHDGVAYEHFRPAGPFASLPLRGNRSSLVWTESDDAAARLKGLPEAEAAIEIEAAMGSCLGAVTVEEPIQTFPLKLQLARDMVAPRLALIGDAAHVIHPVAGQGLNLGLKDVAALAEVVIDAMRLGLDPGAPDVLARYQRWRRFDTALMAAVTDGMNRLFSNDVAPVRALRDLGLGLVERMPTIKDALVARAAGVERGGPRLLRGRGLSPYSAASSRSARSALCSSGSVRWSSSGSISRASSRLSMGTPRRMGKARRATIEISSLPSGESVSRVLVSGQTSSSSVLTSRR
jgi:2-octaprenyl-6-methoxyphenol hydroxylase